MQHASIRSTYMPGSALQGQQGQQRSPHSAASSAVVSKPGYRAITAPLERSLRSSSFHFQSESTLGSVDQAGSSALSATFQRIAEHQKRPHHEAPRCSVNGVLRRRSSLHLPFGSTQALHSRLQPCRTVPCSRASRMIGPAHQQIEGETGWAGLSHCADLGQMPASEWHHHEDVGI